MKKIFCILITTFILGTSCENVLDKEPLDIIGDNVVWKDKSLVDAYILDIYSRMTFLYCDAGTSNQQQYQLYFVDNMADQSTNGRKEDTYAKWQRGVLDQSGGFLEYWDYANVRRINTFFTKIESSTIPDADKIQFKGRVKFARALTYFAMVKRYGGVPLILKEQAINTPLEDLMVPRSKEVEIYDFIINECNEIISNQMLPLTASTTRKGDPSVYAAYALISRAALYAASIAQWGTVQINGLVGIPATDAQRFWKISYDASKKIIDGPFSLYNKIPGNKAENYRMMMIDEASNPEVIWARYYDGVTVYHNFDCSMGLRPVSEDWLTANMCPYLEFVDEYENADGTSSKWDRALVAGKLWSPEELLGSKEPRFKGSIYYQGSSYAGVNNIQMYYGIRKPDGSIVRSGSYQGISVEGVNTRNSGRDLSGFYAMKGANANFPLFNKGASPRIQFRLGEIYLNFAEAAFYLGKTADALAYVNSIRSRVNLPTYTVIDEAKIRHERNIELAFESLRYWDLKRWRIFVATYTKSFTGINWVLDYATNKFLIEFKNNYKVNTFLEKHYYFPITPSRISNTPVLVENPGYASK